jgi:hypothetical protein
VVVGKDGPALCRRPGKIGPAGDAEIVRCRLGRIEHVLRIGYAITVAVSGVGHPGRRDELHRAHGPPVGGRWAVDRRMDRPGHVEPGAVIPAVIGFDLADAGQ